VSPPRATEYVNPNKVLTNNAFCNTLEGGSLIRSKQCKHNCSLVDNEGYIAQSALWGEKKSMNIPFNEEIEQ
jgi:hypothetical protein